MDSNVTSLLEDILGIEKAKACIQEIEARIHPEDSGMIRVQLIKEILYRHIESCDLSMRDLLNLVKDNDSHYLLSRLSDMLTDKVYRDIKDDYKPKEM